MISHKRLYLISSAAVILLFLFSGLLTLLDYGMSWDENIRWRSGDLKLQYYEQLLHGDQDSLRDVMAADRYPGLFDLPLAAFHKIFGGDRLIQGHVWSILFGVLGLVSIFWMARIVFGDRTAFFSTLLLAILPHFYGHAMINPKDIPFMATYCLGLASVLWITKSLLNGSRIRWSAYLACGLATGLAVSSRVPGIILLGMASVAWMTATLWSSRAIQRDSFISWLKGCLITGVSALAVLLVFFPRLHFQLFSGISEVTTALHSSAGEIPLLFAGRAMNASDAPAYYAHAFFLISTPVWMLILLSGGIALCVHELVTHRRQVTQQTVLLAFFLAFAAFPWVYILITRPALHNGIRHLLFGLPPLVILMSYALHRVFEKLREYSAKSQLGAAAIVALLVVSQVIHLVRMHPYQYVSFNLLAGERATVINRYEGEYWFTSSKQLLEALPKVAHELGFRESASTPLKVRIAGPLNSARRFVPDGVALVDSFAEADFYIANTTFRTDMLAEGKQVYQITRQGIPIGVIQVLHPEKAPSSP